MSRSPAVVWPAGLPPRETGEKTEKNSDSLMCIFFGNPGVVIRIYYEIYFSDFA